MKSETSFENFLRNTRRKIKAFAQEVNVLDVILFGSLRRGKADAADIDILLLVKESRGALSLSQHLRALLGGKTSVTVKTYGQLFDPAFLAREAVLAEGYSLVYDAPVADGLGFSAYVLYRYELGTATKSSRMRFYYALHGRDGPGILDACAGLKFSERIVLVPTAHAEEFKQFLISWKLSYLEMPILLPSRLKMLLR